MDEAYDWSGFYQALCQHGPELLSGIDDSGVVEVIAMVAATEDEFWSEGLEPLLARGATLGNLRAGVLSTLRLWRQNVVAALAESFAIELDPGAVGIDTDSPLIDYLVSAATPRLAAEPSGDDSREPQNRTTTTATAAPGEPADAESMGHDRRRLETLRSFRRALRQELHTLAVRPGLTWQQLHNRLQWANAALTERVTEERDRRSRPGAGPWVHPYSPLPESAALVRTLTLPGRERGRGGWVRCAVSPDGSWIVAAGLDKKLRIWDAATGEELASFAGAGLDFTVSPDGARIVSVGHSELRILDAFTGIERTTFPDARGPCAVSPDGTWIVSATADRMLKVWDVATGAERVTLTGHSGPVNDCVVSPDGTWIVSASESSVSTWVPPDNKLRVWDAATGEVRATLAGLGGHTSGVNGCAVSPDGAWIVSASSDKTLKIWDVATGTVRMTLTGHTSRVNGCAVTPDGAWIVSASSDRTLKIWDVATGAELATLTGHTDTVSGCTVSPDGTWIVSSSVDDTVRVWNAATSPRAAPCHTEEVSECVMSPDGAWIVSASQDGTLKIWDVATGAERVTLIGHSGPVFKCAVSPDGTWIVSAGVSDNFDDTLKIWDVSSGTELVTVSGRWDEGTEEFERNECSVSPDGTWIVSDGHFGLTIWDAPSGSELVALTEAWGTHAVSRDGAWIVSTASDYALKVWDVATGAELATLTGHTDWVQDCAVGPDGTWIVSASSDKTVRMWDVATGAELATLVGHSGAVERCVASPDGAWIVSVDRENAVKVWDVATRTEHATLIGHTADVAGCAVSPDGRWIVSASRDKTVRIWDVATGSERAMLVLPAAPTPAVFHPCVPMVAVGDSGGGVHLARIVGIDYGPLIVSAVDLGDGPQIRCPSCNRAIPWRDEYRGQVVACPLQGCGKPLKMSPWVVGEQ